MRLKRLKKYSEINVLAFIFRQNNTTILHCQASLIKVHTNSKQIEEFGNVIANNNIKLKKIFQHWPFWNGTVAIVVSSIHNDLALRWTTRPVKTTFPKTDDWQQRRRLSVALLPSANDLVED